MTVTDADIERFRRQMNARCGVDVSFADAKIRYFQLLNLFWILAHKPPEKGEPPYEPPAPPWL